MPNHAPAKHQFLREVLPAIVVSLFLFIGGIIILIADISGWSLILGVPATQIGIIFSIFTFDRIINQKIDPENLHIVHCSICHAPVVVPANQALDICPDCQEKILKK